MSTAGYLSLTDADREAMLEAIGVASLDELFAQIPAGVRFDRDLDVPAALPEAALVRRMEELAAMNADTSSELSFLGMGIYDHYVPAIVDTFLSRGELLTAYTPYQPEMSQGVLQAIFEYQTAICELTGMDVSNASGYDGTTVAADACFIARHHTGRTKVVLAEALNPQVRQVVKTYAPGFGMEVVEVPHTDGATDPGQLAPREKRVDDRRHVVVVDAHPEEAQLARRIGVHRGELLHPADERRLRERIGHVEVTVEPNARRDLSKELVERRNADRLEHRLAVGVRQREVSRGAHGSPRSRIPLSQSPAA